MSDKACNAPVVDNDLHRLNQSGRIGKAVAVKATIPKDVRDLINYAFKKQREGSEVYIDEEPTLAY